jgi:hypothetical protein
VDDGIRIVGDDVATGYEIPFDEPATTLIFKTQPRDATKDFFGYIREMAATLAADHDAGTPFRFDELPEDHAAWRYAKSLGIRPPAR